MRARIAAVALGAAVMLSLAGCTTPQPTPTPTPAFANDEEAFAAAEATYRAYVDALNQVDLSDPETFEAVYDLTTGEANADERKSLSQMHADAWQVDGDTALVGFFGDSVTDGSIHAVVCSDVSAVAVTDANGQSMVSAERPNVYALSLTFVEASTPTGLAIGTSEAVDDGRCS